MKLVKNFRIDEVRAMIGDLYILKLRSDDGDTSFELTLTKDTCKEYGINPSLKLAGRIIQYTLTTRSLRRKPLPKEMKTPGRKPASYADMNDMKMDEMWLTKVTRTETHEQVAGMSSGKNEPMWQEVVYRLVAQEQFNEDHLVTTLTEKEYKKCIKLPIGTVLKAKFRLLPQEKAQKERRGKAKKK